jgi:hypothetical protein
MNRQPLKLNLGSGAKRIEGFLNVDYSEECKPDVVMDLEEVPWQFEDNSVSHIVMSHVMEHLGQTPQRFIAIIKELYRICENQALIDITEPHPSHDFYVSDPTHTRPITPLLLTLFDRELNLQWREVGASNSPLALQHNVNFKILSAQYRYDRGALDLLQKTVKDPGIVEMFLKFGRNIIGETHIEWQVVK